MTHYFYTKEYYNTKVFPTKKGVFWTSYIQSKVLETCSGSINTIHDEKITKQKEKKNNVNPKNDNNWCLIFSFKKAI